VPCGDLDVTERYAGVECSHDECSSEHVRMHRREAGAFADGAHPAARGAAVEAFAVPAPQDRPLVAFTDGRVGGR
jgi:hypothetical protein